MAPTHSSKTHCFVYEVPWLEDLAGNKPNLFIEREVKIGTAYRFVDNIAKWAEKRNRFMDSSDPRDIAVCVVLIAYYERICLMLYLLNILYLVLGYSFNHRNGLFALPRYWEKISYLKT